MTNCSNHGKCQMINENSLKCNCDQNFAGNTCQLDQRPCSSNPCLNGGLCISENLTNFSFRCECKPSYSEGIYCENRIDICKEEKCSGNGKCIDINGQTKCECFYLYYGQKCEKQTSELESIKQGIRLSSIIAIIIMIVFYLIIVLIDLTNLKKYIKEGKKLKYKESKHRKKNIVKYYYVN